MKRFLALALAALSLAASLDAAPLRVFIRGGEANRGPQVHAHPRFFEEWKKLLAERGMQVDGAKTWPTAQQLQNTDVVVVYAQEGGDATPEQEKAIEDFVKRGGGLVVIHTAAVSMTNPPWWRNVIGGAWVPGKTKWREGPMDLYFVENQFIDGGHPITREASNFRMDDEIYYDMDILPAVRVLATSYTPNVREGKKPAEGNKPHIYDIQPQMWVYENKWEGGTQPYRAFVTLPGHQFATFERPNYRAILLRGIAWAGKRENIDEFCKPEEISSLRYPEGGPQKPEQTLSNLEIHPDFSMKLVAAEPLITKPMNFDWDPAGRMWVAETPEYPNGRRGMRPDYRGKEWKDHGGIDPTPGDQERPARDRISILIDTNGDGVADKKEVFYEGLDLVTGLVFHKDGVIVTQAPDILWLRDTNGDGKADKVEKLYGGLGTGDTHAVINNPRWGWDGWIYATHGYSGSNRVVNAKGERMPNIGSGVVRFKPDGSRIEQYSSKGGNTWGLTITGDNRVMWTQPTSGQLLMHTILPEYALSRGKLGNTSSFKVVEPSPKSFPLLTWEQLAYVQIDWVGSFTAAAGTVVYDGGAWPKEYNGDYFTTEPTINIIHHTRLTPQGSSYTASKLPGREETEFIRSKDMWWRPIEVRVGPDGAMYVADFYNQAVIHNDTRGPDHNRVNAAVRPDRDHYFGRIWRVDHKQAQKIAVPDLTKAGAAQLAAALKSPNAATRFTAHRLLTEKFTTADVKAAVEPLLKDANPETRIAAMWTLFRSGQPAEAVVRATVQDADPAVRRNAALVAEAAAVAEPGKVGLTAALSDENPHVRLAALLALGASPLQAEDAKALVAAWPKFDDDYQRSAAIGAASKNAPAAIAAALDSPDAASLGNLVRSLAESVTSSDAAAALVVALSTKPASADPVKKSILDVLARNVKEAPAMTPQLSQALARLLASGASGSVLPIAAKWDKAGTLKAEIGRLTGALFTQLSNAQSSDEVRTNAAASLIGLRSTDEKILPAVISQLGREGSASFKRQLIQLLGETNEPAVGAALAAELNKLPADAQLVAFDALLKRSDWALAFLDAVQAKKVDPTVLGPANAFRLRTHPDKAVAKRAGDMLDELNPMAKAKKEAIAKLAPIVEQPGNVEKGKALFATTCATCHKFGDVGANIGPGLTGMGSHGAGELLTAIVDPNAEVDPSFVTWNIETKDGQFYSGIIERENPTSILLRSLAGEQEVKVSDIKSRVNTGRSLMPEGFEGLGGEQIRDIIAYMQSVDGGRFRTIDLSKAFTVNSARGIYQSESNTKDTLKFAKTGNVNVEGVPFNIIAPERAPLNLLQLRGGPGGSFAKSLPQRVEVAVGGFKANRLHFLGGVAGWGFPFGGENEVVMTVTVHFADGKQESLQLKNGVEFADYIREVNVPGSKLTRGLVKENQLRWFSKDLKHTGPIDRITLESANTIVAPTTVAITAELADPNKPAAKSDESAAAPWPSRKYQRPAGANGNDLKWLRVLLVGGGASHDYKKWFGDRDIEILKQLGVAKVEYTENVEQLTDGLPDWDVVVVSANKPLTSEARRSLMEVANTGRGLVVLHPGLWYNWNNFSIWNREVCGGGSRGHDKLGEFAVTVANREHPVTKGLPADFKITDELYYFEPDANGTPIEVLATATSKEKNKTFPQVFVVKHPKTRIVGITLGHDGRAHDLPEFQALLKQAVAWVAGK